MKRILIIILSLLLGVGVAAAQDEPSRATIVNDEGGPAIISGTLTYSNLLFTSGVSEPLIILESEAGFVDRNLHAILPVESQVLGQITSDFYTSPVDYTLSLPEIPNGPYRDVDNDNAEEQGVQIYGIAYWQNVWGDPYLEVRDLYGYGYSSAYASMATSPDPSKIGEVIGGKYIVYAPDDRQGFPSGFGEDGLLFTEDDPIVLLPAGYTTVDMDTDPFTFDRSREPVIDLIEGEGAALDDYSQLGYAEGFQGLIDQMRNEYAFTEYKNIDWDALEAEFLPRFEQAERDNDAYSYVLALSDFNARIPDNHVGSSASNYIAEEFLANNNGGLGMAIRELDDGRVVVNFVLPGGPADEAGIELLAEIVSYDGQPISDALDAVTPAVAFSFGVEHRLRLEQLRYLLRSAPGTDVTITYRNPDGEEATATLTSVEESESFDFASIERESGGLHLPVEYELLGNGYAYVAINGFADDDRLSILLWERLMRDLNNQSVPGLIIDMRHNGGGSGWLANQMAAYFFDDALDLGNAEVYDESKGGFYLEPEAEEYFYPPEEALRYRGEIAVLVGPDCVSACEFFARDMTLQDRAAIVGQYPTAGGGGGIEAVLLPEGIYFQFPIARNLDAEGNILIEGVGVKPTVKVPVDEQTVISKGDPILNAAIEYLDGQLS